MVLASDRNKDFAFELYNGSLKTAINGNVTTVCTERTTIQRASYLLDVVGKIAAKSEWEVQTAVELRKKLIGVKIARANESSKALLNNGAKWALSFNFDAIKKVVDSVY